MSLLSRFKGRDTQFKDTVMSYKKVFGSIEGKEVLVDLANRSYFLTEITGTQEECALKEGKRQAFLGILKNLQLTTQDLDRIITGEF